MSAAAVRRSLAAIPPCGPGRGGGESSRGAVPGRVSLRPTAEARSRSGELPPRGSETRRCTAVLQRARGHASASSISVGPSARGRARASHVSVSAGPRRGSPEGKRHLARNDRHKTPPSSRLVEGREKSDAYGKGNSCVPRGVVDRGGEEASIERQRAGSSQGTQLTPAVGRGVLAEARGSARGRGGREGGDPCEDRRGGGQGAGLARSDDGVRGVRQSTVR